MNLPNALTVGRIAATPLIAVLPFANSVGLRLVAFVLFTIAAITDYVDGRLARSRKEETDLGRLLDPLADKLLLFGTLIPMYILTAELPFITPVGTVGLFPLGEGRDRARARSLHDGVSTSGKAARRRNRGDRTGEVENRVSARLARVRVLLVFRGHLGRRQGLEQRTVA